MAPALDVIAEPAAGRSGPPHVLLFPGRASAGYFPSIPDRTSSCAGMLHFPAISLQCP